MDIQDTHPLRQLAEIQHVVPCVSLCIKKKKKKNFEFALKRALLYQLDLKIPKSDEMIQDDPFLVLGYGVNAYFDMLSSLSLMFLTITLFCIPVFYLYGSHYAFEDFKSFPIARFTLGNMGSSSIFCQQNRLGKDIFTVTCPNESVIDAENLMVGMISADTQIKTACTQAKQDEFNVKGGHQDCTPTLNKKKARARIIEQCDDQNSCEFSMKGLQKITHHDGECGPNSYLFVQVPCIIPAKEGRPAARQIEGLAVGCIAVFIYLYTLVYFDYIRCVQANLYIDWDVKTITAGDYTVEFDIDEALYKQFLEKFYDQANPISEINQFRLFVKDELERRLTKFPDLGLDGDDSDVADKQIKVAVITFAFDNQKIIKWLR